MKQIATAVVTTAMAFSATAQEAIQYYSLTSATTPHLSVTDSWIQDMRKTLKVDWYPGLSCGGKDTWQKDQRPKMVEFVSGRYWQSLDENNTSCTMDLNGMRYISMLEYTYEVCVPSNSPFKSIQDIVSAPKATMAYGSGTALHKWATDVNQKYQANIKPVVFKASGAAMLGTLAGDTDFAFVASLVAAKNVESGKVRCFATTQSGQKSSLDRLLPKVDPLLNGHVNLFPLAATGLSNKDLDSARSSVARVSKTAILPPGVSIFVAQNAKDEEKIKSRVEQQINDLYRVTKNIK